MKAPILCAYALGAINYKNGFVTSCPQQSDQLHIMKDGIIKPSEIINSENFRKHRQELMNGVWSPGCHLCKEAEQIGSHSMRNDYEEDGAGYNLDGTVNLEKIFHIELRFSNACNMACLHCSDVYSSGWMSKLKNYTPDSEDKKYKLLQLTREFHRSSKDDNLSISISLEEMETIVDDLNANFPNITKIDFAGGEVLYQKQFFPCLKKLAKHPNAKNINIAFHTNFNAKFNPVELSECLKPFKHSNIKMSLDAGTNIYSYFRTGDWEVLKNHIKKFREINTTSEMNIICTTSVYQIMDIENIFSSFLTLDIDVIESSIVYTPRYINPALMVLKFKDAVYDDIQKTYQLIMDEKKRRLDNFQESRKLRTWDHKRGVFTDIESAFNAVKNIEHYVFNHQCKEEEYESLLVYIRKSDMIWKHNFNDYMKNYKFENNQIVRVKNV